MTTSTASQSTIHQPTIHQPDPAYIERLIDKRSFATLATVSPAGRSHSAGVIYERVGDALWVNTKASTRKARNIEASPHVAMTIAVRRVPVGGPPSLIHFQSTARLVKPEAPELTALIDQGKLKAITSHGELDLPDSCFVRIELPNRLLTYGLGMSLLQLIRHPLDAGGFTRRA